MSDEFLLSLYRFDPEKDERPYMSDYKISHPETGNMMVIDAIRQAQEKDSTVTFRRSCAQGVCGIRWGKYEWTKWTGMHNSGS